MNYGDIISLGNHLLMCGDATRPQDVHYLIGRDTVNLVFTDPPYGVRSVDKSGKIGKGGTPYKPVIGDTDTDMFHDAWRILRGVSTQFIIWGGQNFTRILPPSCGWIFWDKCKNSDALSFGDGELAWSNINTKIKKYAFKWNGFCRDGDKELNAKRHPNQKPVELTMQILEDYTNPGDIILDCFAGSGTTLIACELTGRKCLAMEISPDYCAIIQERYHELNIHYA